MFGFWSVQLFESWTSAKVGLCRYKYLGLDQYRTSTNVWVWPVHIFRFGPVLIFWSGPVQDKYNFLGLDHDKCLGLASTNVCVWPAQMFVFGQHKCLGLAGTNVWVWPSEMFGFSQHKCLCLDQDNCFGLTSTNVWVWTNTNVWTSTNVWI